MTEHEIEDLLWNYPELLIEEPLTQYRRQPSSGVSRADLVFVDSIGRLLVVEVKKGILSREAIPQTLDHFGGVKSQHPDRIVEMMVVANRIPRERKTTLENYYIAWREIPEQRIRAVAADKDYVFRSEREQATTATAPIVSTAPSGVATQLNERSTFAMQDSTYLKVMPMSPKTGQPLYSHGAAREVFELVAMREWGATVREIRAAAISSVALYPVTKHCREDGKRGWCWKLYIDGKQQSVDATHGFSRSTLDQLPDTARIHLGNFQAAKRHNDSHGWS